MPSRRGRWQKYRRHEKIIILGEVAAGKETKTAIARKYQIDPSTIHDWIRKIGLPSERDVEEANQKVKDSSSFSPFMKAIPRKKGEVRAVGMLSVGGVVCELVIRRPDGETGDLLGFWRRKDKREEGLG